MTGRVLASVVSHPRERRYVLDAGLKALAGENYGWGTYGRILDRPDIENPNFFAFSV